MEFLVILALEWELKPEVSTIINVCSRESLCLVNITQDHSMARISVQIDRRARDKQEIIKSDRSILNRVLKHFLM